MKTSPILFSTPMVQAILEGRKTQTRREMKPQPDATGKVIMALVLDGSKRKSGLYLSREGKTVSVFPKYQVGDILWVRETWRRVNHYGFDYEFIQYKDGSTNAHCEIVDPDQLLHDEKWKPSIFMPKEACRIFLEVTNLRVERLQKISEEDAIAEGVQKHSDYGSTGYILYTEPEAAHTDIDAIWSFESLWQSINGNDSWEANPWVWVYDFKRVEKPINF